MSRIHKTFPNTKKAEELKSDAIALEGKVAEFNEMAPEARIDDTNSARAVEILARAKKVLKAIDALRKEANAGANEAIKAVNAEAKVFTQKLDVVIDHFGDLVRRRALADQAKERAAREEIERLAALSKQSQDPEDPALEEARLAAQRAANKNSGPARGSHGAGASVVTTYHPVVTDQSAVPAEFLVTSVDMIKVAAHLKGKKESDIPGIVLEARSSVRSF